MRNRDQLLRANANRPAPCWMVWLALAGSAAACAAPDAGGLASDVPEISIDRERVETALSALAADSMEGRLTGTGGARRAARFLASQLESAGIDPAGDSGYVQHVPLMAGEGRRRWRLPLDADTANASPDAVDANIVGIIQGRMTEEAIVVGAHYDHVGIRQPVDGDSIYNGADDDASGVVAVLETARALAQLPQPERTVVFLLSTGEEVGLLGTRWYIEHPTVPLNQTVANVQIEMIARPDSLVGGSGVLWLTGDERSSMGEAFRLAGLSVVPDPRVDQNFFERSDNIAFARLGIPAHTLSSFSLHADYHRPSDEVDRADLQHMTSAIETVARAVWILANGPPPEWRPGGQPTAR